jgi:hypothetical protein
MCGAPVPEEKRGDSKFCTTTCKARHWARMKKAKKDGLSGIKLDPEKEIIPPPEDDQTPQEQETFDTPPIEKKEEITSGSDGPGPFYNVIYEPGEDEKNVEPDQKNPEENTTDKKEEPTEEEPLPEKYFTRMVKKETDEYKQCKEKLDICRTLMLETQDTLKGLDSNILSYKKAMSKPANFAIVYKRMLEFQPLIAKAEHLKKEAERLIGLYQEQEKELEKELIQYPVMETEEKVVSIYYLYKKVQRDGINNRSLKEPLEEKIDTDNNLSSDIEKEKSKPLINKGGKKKNDLESDLIFSGEHLSKKKKPKLNFIGKWEKFLGQPQTNFFCVIHGKSGHGKSSFALQFAKYLAQNFGTVLYISGEEGFANTFIEKVEVIGFKGVSRFYAVEKIKRGEDILKYIPNKFHFVFIDSLNNMHIDPKLMQALRNKYSQSGFIAICQNTKAGQFRGSYEIVHDSDMEIRVEKGIAITNKNRFKDIDQEFDALTIYPGKRNKDKDSDDNKDL